MRIRLHGASFLLGVAAIASVPACAVYLEPSGAGQALIFPYYTVRASGASAYNTYISVASRAETASVVAKVRFHEGRNSRTVLDFNVYLAANDMWTAALVPDGAGTRLITRDGSCTDPAIPAEGVPFRTSAFAAGDDRAGTGAERTTE